MKQILSNVHEAVLGCNIQSLSYLLRGRPGVFMGSCLKAYETSRLWKPGKKNNFIPLISLSEILGERKPVVTLNVTAYEEGMLPAEDALVLIASLVAEAPREVLEIGTFMGHTTRLMAENCPQSIIHTVDLPLDFNPADDLFAPVPKDDFHLICRRQVGREFNGRPCSARIKQHYKDTSCWNFAECGKPTFFFIDGSHTYEHCKSDSEKCYDLCAGKGVFFWHDVNTLHPGVLKFVTEWRRMGRDIRRVKNTDLAYWKS